jgi:tripartite-type tricarboxylate transporter receptor subunit TctC
MKMSIIVRWRYLAAMALSSTLCAMPVLAQDYPTREIKVVCAYAAGTGADTMVRFYAAKLQDLAGKPVIVENKPGAFGNIGAETVARARPDGYTLLITPAAASHAMNVHSFKKLPYDPVKDFEPVALLSEQAFVLVVGANNNINSVRDLTAHLKAKQGKAAYGVPNVSAHLSGELYKSIAGFEATAVRYQATPQALTDMIGGQLDFIFADSVFAIEQAKAGRVKALGITLSRRSAASPDLPTVAEAGVPGFEFAGWWAGYFPAGTPKPIVNKMSAWLLQIVGMEETKRFLLNAGNEPYGRPPDVLSKFQVEYTDRMGAIFKKAGIEPQ